MSPYGRARSPAVRATLDYLRGFYLARLRLVKTRRQKDVSTCTAAMSRWACATLDCVQWCIVFNVRVCLIVFFVILGFVHFLSFCFTRQRKKKENEPKERKTRLWGFAFLACIGLFGLVFSCVFEAFGSYVWLRG